MERFRQKREAAVRKAVAGVLTMVLAVVLTCLAPPESRAEITFTDAAGRQVRLAAPARRVLLNDSLLLMSMALIDPDPIGRIVGWGNPQRIDKGTYRAFRQRFPAIDKIASVGGVVPGTASAEGILSARPDVFIVNSFQPGWEAIIDLLTAAGVPVVFLDGPVNDSRGPDEATAFSIELLGKVIGQEEKASDYAAFVRARYRAVRDRLAGSAERPKVLVDAFAGSECCSTPGRNNRLKQTVEMAGGTVVGAEQIAGYEGRLSAEAVLALEPDVYIGTGGPQMAGQQGLVLGGDFDAATAQKSLADVLSQPIRRELKPVRQGRAYGISHQLSISALSVLAFECFAKWLHPQLFADLDADATRLVINRRFLAVPLEGTFWTGPAPVGTKP